MSEARRGPALPWEGKATRADVICLAGVSISGIYALALLPTVPWLLTHHPLVLELAYGSTSAMVTMGALSRVGEASLLVTVLAAFPGCMIFDWLFWWAGRLWGHRAVHVLLGGHPDNPRQAERMARREARIDRFAGRFGGFAVVVAYFLPVPSTLVYATAGLSGMRLSRFLLLDVIGTGLWIALIVSLGYALGQRAVDVVDAVNHYSLLITLALVAVIVLMAVWRSRR